jgi:hypothetical protein
MSFHVFHRKRRRSVDVSDITDSASGHNKTAHQRIVLDAGIPVRLDDRACFDVHSRGAIERVDVSLSERAKLFWIACVLHLSPQLNLSTTPKDKIVLDLLVH